MTRTITRRRVLRGMLQGSGIGVGLPLLDLFLNDNGSALADGNALPLCFGSWYWPFGFSPGMWEPKTDGQNYELPPQLQQLAPIKDKINVFSDMQIFLDGKVQTAHISQPQVIMSGYFRGASYGFMRPTLDVILAEQMRVRTRFKSLVGACDGVRANTYSSRGENAVNPPDTSPIAMYQRIFGDGFVDPNAGEFTPDPAVMLRKSVLSTVTEDRQDLVKAAGASDRARLDEFFTSLRELEQKLALELQKPAPMEACDVPDPVQQTSPNFEIDQVMLNHSLFASLIAHALACGQTRIFNLSIGQETVRSGDPTTNHTYTHEENIDDELGYQPNSYWFANRYMAGFKEMVQTLDGVKEGDGTLLDRTLMLGWTDHGFAKYHSIEKYPAFMAGSAGGAVKTGYHVAGHGSTCTRLGLTCLHALGAPYRSWGEDSNTATEPFSDVLA